MIIQYDLNKFGGIRIHGRAICICDKCNKEFIRIMGTYIKHLENIKIDGDYCTPCVNSMMNKEKEHIERVTKTLARFWKSDDSLEARKRSSDRMKQNNPMYNTNTRLKMKKSRKRMLEDDKEFIEQIRENTTKAWADGKFNGVKVGQCKWYNYESSNGDVYKVQGTWELAFIEWIDNNNLKFKCHKDRIPYMLNGLEKNYYPDFWIEDWECYVDVKCKHFYNKGKFDAIRKCNPDLELKVLFRDDLRDLGIDI